MSDDQDGTELELDRALLDFMRRFDAGKIDDRESFLEEYPEIASRLRTLLDAADWIEDMAGPTLIELGNSTSEGAHRTNASEMSDASLVDSNAVTRPPKFEIELGWQANQPKITSDDSTLPPPRRQADFSLASLANTNNSQSILPYRFGDYILEQVLGRGGMGVVYLAFQVQLERRVALKMIRSGCLASEDEVTRFHTEARSAASLMHPNIVTVYHCGECEGHHFFSMDFIPGTDLAKRISSGPMSPREATRYVRDVARAIDYAHQEGVVHRDLKPANVLIDEEDQVVVTDFGLAKQMDSDQGLTATGAALGTPSYMSPEQAAGKSEEQGASTDVYAIGAILFALLTGKPPFQADSVMQTIMQVIHRPAPTVRQSHPNVHPDLDTIVTKCLEKLPSRRYASAGELAEDLDRFYQGIPISARPPSFFRRTQHWLANVPLVAAFTGARNVEPSPSQRMAQNAMIAGLLALALVWLTGGYVMDYVRNTTMPRNLSIASGAPGGMYYELAGKLANRLQANNGSELRVIATNGSLENLRQLVDNNAQMALMQESSVRADQVAVVAPLFYEAVHILVPANSDIQHVPELKGKQILMGTKDSGTYQAATRLLKHYGVTAENVSSIESDWTHTDQVSKAEVVIAVTRVGQKGIADLLNNGEYRMLPIDHAADLALKEPMFRLFEIPANAYGPANAPVLTLATTALLVVRRDAPARLVEECLIAIYNDKPPVEGIISLNLAADWQGLPYHEAARRYFKRNEESP